MIYTLSNSVEFDTVVLPIYQEENPENEFISSIINKEIFTPKLKEIYVYINPINFNRTIVVGLGEKDKIDANKFMMAIAKAAKEAKKLEIGKYSVVAENDDKLSVIDKLSAIVQATSLGIYEFNKYKSDKKEYTTEISIQFEGEITTELTETLKEEINIAEGILIARDLVNEPANVIYPESLANRVVELSEKIGVEVEVFDHEQIQEMGMDALWSVGKGSCYLPRLIVMRHMGNPDSDEVFGIIGKGLTYDTGGYSIKPTNSMANMKSDMGGAGAVIGLMNAVVKNNIKQNVIVVVAAAENAISENSYKPGDIIGSMGGKTIEVLNTDAEGRLTLVDAVTYAIRKENVTKIIDIATLTGAVLVALGDVATGVVTNDDEFYSQLVEASTTTDEKFWQLPVFEEYKELIKGKIADLANSNTNRLAGSITAGLFIGEFVEDKPWLHLDIAGTGWAERTISEMTPKGATGTPIKTLYNLLK
ncbi:MAG: leucyl aminopeptidase [Epulopiscium sp. Nele67-Bin004]|nr:MAG: leucyl aminopeptidase [Epulopiscium sp. Nele67-Bin004]